MTKKCNKCLIEKPRTEFHKNNSIPSGIRSRCKKCEIERKQQPEVRDAINLRLRGSKHKTWRKQYMQDPTVKHMNRGHHLRKYWPGASAKEALENYDKLFQAQDGRCLLCGIHQDEYKRSFDVDHCHETGKVRGLLCTTDNRLVGLFETKFEAVSKIQSYILENKKVG